jgi:hypothetical protein
MYQERPPWGTSLRQKSRWVWLHHAYHFDRHVVPVPIALIAVEVFPGETVIE